jgi:CHASE1-domain containing sensor protein
MEDLSKIALVPANLNFEALQKQNQELKGKNTILLTAVILIAVSGLVFVVVQKLNEERENNNL